jgi:anaerobic ribonucleoside-triphosphate reductase activating protein
MTVSELLQQCAAELAEADGVTITGGEPFEQPAALRELLDGVRSDLRPGADVLVYSGLSSVQLKPQLAELEGLIDVLCAGPFHLTASQTRPLMGSDNQELLLLTEVGMRNFSGYLPDDGHRWYGLDGWNSKARRPWATSVNSAGARFLFCDH